ncbi:MAG: hypothetical protein QOE53_1007, partial [Pseudonocardiales bacterium]|nr:hypothetical protein [Pseudonocardiales bacterium]
GSILDTWLAAHGEGTACVISASAIGDGMLSVASRVRRLTPELSKGLEFDLVVLVDPEAFGTGAFGTESLGTVASDTRIRGAVDRYVAMTRATQQLVLLTSR